MNFEPTVLKKFLILKSNLCDDACEFNIPARANEIVNNAKKIEKLFQSGKRDSNPLPTAWEAVALPGELLPLIL